MTCSQVLALADLGQHGVTPDPARALTDQSLRDVASLLASGVVVVSTSEGNFDHAMTATSFNVLSLDPMLAMVSVQCDTRFHDALCGLEGNFGDSVVPDSPGSDQRAGHGWAVSVLPEDEVPMASWFATKGRPLHGQFDRFAHHRAPRTNAIVFDDAIAWLELRTWAQYPGGDHTLVVGEVVNVGINPDPGSSEPRPGLTEPELTRNPLIHWARRYHNLRP